MTETEVSRVILHSSIDDLHTLYEKREVSPVEVLEAVLERLEQLEPRLRHNTP